MFGELAQYRPLMIMGIAESVSGVGNWITAMAVFALLVFRSGGNVVESSGIFLAGLLPTLLLSPLAGWLCDRLDRKRLMIASELLAGGAVVGLMFAGQPAWIYALLAAQAAVGAVMMPARQAAIPALVAPEALTRANAFLQQLAGMVKIGAPMLAGAVLVVLTPRQAMILDVVSFGLSALILTQLPALPPARREAAPPAAPGGAPAPTATPLRVLRQSTPLALLFAATFLTIVNIMAFDVLAPVFTRDVLGGAEGLFGLLVGLVGLGTVAGAAGLLLRKRQTDPWRDLIAALLLLACIPGTLAGATALGGGPGRIILTGAGCLLGGLGCGLINVQAATLLQRLAPPALLGRLGGLFQSTLVAGQLVAIFITPLLVPAVIAMGPYFAATAALIVLVAAGTALVIRRRPPTPAPARRDVLA